MRGAEGRSPGHAPVGSTNAQLADQADAGIVLGDGIVRTEADDRSPLYRQKPQIGAELLVDPVAPLDKTIFERRFDVPSVIPEDLPLDLDGRDLVLAGDFAPRDDLPLEIEDHASLPSRLEGGRSTPSAAPPWSALEGSAHVTPRVGGCEFDKGGDVLRASWMCAIARRQRFGHRNLGNGGSGIESGDPGMPSLDEPAISTNASLGVRGGIIDEHSIDWRDGR